MNRKGFISMTIVYSFFLILLSLMTFIILNMATNRLLLNNMKKSFKSDIADTGFSHYLINNYEVLGLKIKGNAYRYVGKSPNNYICFGSNEDICPEDNLYRIIGIFDDKIKIVKNNSISYIYDENYNDYSNSSIYNYLNNEYNISNKENIFDNTWYIQGLSSIYINNPNNILQNELNNKDIIIIAKIGLIYISDYLYASDNNIISIDNNWLYTNNMWFISRNSDNDNTSYYLNELGYIEYTSVNNTKEVKPTFFLNKNIKYINGDGTINNPYKVG